MKITLIIPVFNKLKTVRAIIDKILNLKDIDIQIILEKNGFNFCPEITTKVSNLGIKIFEVPNSYNGRTHKEGKKIKLIHGFEAILTIIKYKFFIRT